MDEKKYIKIMIACLGLIILLSLFFVTLITWPYKVLEIKEIKTLTPVVKAGELFRWQVSFCKFMNLQGTTERKLIDSKNVVWLTVEQETRFAPGCTIATLDMLVPENAPSGYYRIKSQTNYQINVFRKEKVDLEIPDFEVLAEEK